jgi:hypothetical protein
MKHTPGPWRIVEQTSTIVVVTESQSKTKYGASRYACIGGFDGSIPEQLSEAMANARIIAAAPDLLEALEMLAAVDFGADGSVERGARLARIAIAKARGE